MPELLNCWKCGAALKDVPLPLSRLSECLTCHAELYVCRMCGFHDPVLRQGCREERAEHVQEKERANFCDYFRPVPDAFQPADRSGEQAAQTRLEALFGKSAPQTDTSTESTHSALDDLFKS
ncbi:MAG TPA: hypothetical protein VFK12_03350 [Gammaproteobacteria bacterium]|nr:hypothetical protein [Gammaproteobacteria bacterium]